MRPPGFWQLDKPTLAAHALSPLGKLFSTATAKRVAKPARYTPAIPVICIGNVLAGGTGKTPATLHIAQALKARGFNPHILSRGYGGSDKGPTLVDPLRHRAQQVGDEPLMLAAFMPVTIARDRALGAKAICDEGKADVIIMDDGFQNPDLPKAASLLVFDGGAGIGNGRCMPAGPLREPLATGMARADAALIIGTDQTDLASALTLPTFHGALTPGPETMWLKGQRVTAFAGIGRPQKFFDTVEALGAQLCGTFPFPDHHPYKAQDLLLIDRHCAKTGSIAVTTEKDAVRLPVSRRGRVSIVRVDLTVEDSDALIDLIMSKTGFVNE